MLPHLPSPHRLEWVRYAQSSRVVRAQDSSVSYAAAVLTLA